MKVAVVSECNGVRTIDEFVAVEASCNHKVYKD